MIRPPDTAEWEPARLSAPHPRMLRHPFFPAMNIDLPQLRDACARDALLRQIVDLCASQGRTAMARLLWCEQRLGRKSSVAGHRELVRIFRLLQAAGFGRLLQSTLRHRARFEWVVLPAAVDLALRSAQGAIVQADLLPSAAVLGFTLREPASVAPSPEAPAGWTRHRLPVRPGATLEMLLPDDLTRAEADWLAGFLGRLADAAPAVAQP